MEAVFTTPALMHAAISLQYLTEIVIGVLGIIVAFGLAVFIHELGHFLGAKMFKVPVERFVIGFDKEAMGFLPRCIWERKIGETVYGVSLVPLGGYVKMSGIVHPDIEKYLDGEPEKKTDGEQPEAESDSKGQSLQEQAMGDMAALYKKPYWQKVIIYGAGVVMNMILAMVAMGLLFSKGFDESAPYPARIGWIAPDNSYAESVLQPGDYILAVNGNPVKNQEEFDRLLSEAAGGKQLGVDLDELSVELTLARKDAEGLDGVLDEQGYTTADALERIPEKDQYTFDLTLTTDEKNLADFGGAFFRREAYLDFVQPNTPADKAGLRRGDTVVSINGEPVEDWSHFSHLVSKSPGEELAMVVQRDDETATVTVTPWEDADRPGRGQVGVIVGNPHKVFTQEPLIAAFANAPARVYNMTGRYVTQLGALGGKLTEGNVTAVSRELGGPVGIGQLAYRMAVDGFTQWMRFLIMLNVALAVMNILPFPVLDGGHIVFATFEAIFRRPVPPKILVPLLNGAVVFILVFFVLVTFNDVRKLFF